MSREMLNNQQEERAIVARGSLMETMVKAATTCNKLLLENCGLCTIYCDKQVQYEWMQDQYRLNHLFQKTDLNPATNQEVKQYQEFLFDEQSVVQSVNSRLDEED
jgi:hypothetical protein